MSLANKSVFVVGAIHFGIAVSEIFLWYPCKLYKRFGLPKFTDEEAKKVAPMAANAGVYNAFLAAGLFWSVYVSDVDSLKLFFISCVAVAGVFGAVTLKTPMIHLLQTGPALVAGALVWYAKSSF